MENDSVLNDVKKILGIDKSYTHFDADLIIHINSVFMILSQIGLGGKDIFTIESERDLWTTFIPNDGLLSCVKSYVSLKVKLLFDPPVASTSMEALNRMISEYEWRISVAVDPPEGVIT